MENEQSVILISGFNRSGTSLFQRLLDGHEELFVFSDEIFFCEDRCQWPDLEDGIKNRHFLDLYEDLKKGIHLKYWLEMSWLRKTDSIRNGSPFDFDFNGFLNDWNVYLDEFIEWSPTIVLTCFLKSFYKNLKNHPKRNGSARFVMKKPRLGFDVERFFEIFPNGKLILLERDFEGFLASEVKRCGYDSLGWNDGIAYKIRTLLKGWLDGRNRDEIIRYLLSSRKRVFVESMAADHKFYQNLLNKSQSNGNVHIIKFEELITNTDLEMKKVAEFLGIEFSESMLSPSVYNRPWRSNSSFQNKQDHVQIKKFKNADIWDEKDKKIIRKIYKQAEPSCLDHVLRKTISPWPAQVINPI